MAAIGSQLHNPGNIERDDSFHYLGEVVPSSNLVFRQFIDDEHGLRAILECLLAYIIQDGITTLGAAIARWAPPSQNDTASYQAWVCSQCSASNDTPFTVGWLQTHAQAMLASITRREVGEVYSVALTSAAIAMIDWPTEHV